MIIKGQDTWDLFFQQVPLEQQKESDSSTEKFYEERQTKEKERQIVTTEIEKRKRKRNVKKKEAKPRYLSFGDLLLFLSDPDIRTPSRDQ